jgi:O-antigen ligase
LLQRNILNLNHQLGEQRLKTENESVGTCAYRVILIWHVVPNAAMHDAMQGAVDQRSAAIAADRIVSNPRPRLAVAALLLVVAYALGGSAGALPGRGMVIELVAILAILLIINNWTGPRPSNSVLLALFAVMGLPLVQMVPLPAQIWTAFPGRHVATDITHLIDPTMWRPLTLDPNATLKTWFALLVPVAMFLAIIQMPSRERLWLVIALVAIAVTSAVLGLLQITSGSDLLYPFVSDHKGLPIGFFANRNHQAALMYAAVCFMVALTQIGFVAERFPAARAVAAGVAILLIATVFATGSRAGMVLMVVSLLLSLLIVFRSRISWKSALVGSAILLIGSALLLNSGVVRGSVERLLSQSSDGRYEFWPEVLYSLGSYFPAGAGLGSFATSYQATEQLATVGTHYVNHAHNDYLEVALEAGAPGVLLVGLLLLLYATCAWRVLVRDPEGDANLLARAAAIAILCLLLHALVDYPLRTFGHLALLGMLAGLLFRPPGPTAVDGKRANPEGMHQRENLVQFPGMGEDGRRKQGRAALERDSDE